VSRVIKICETVEFRDCGEKVVELWMTRVVNQRNKTT